MVYRNASEINREAVLKDLTGWDIFPHTPSGVEAAVQLMSGEKIQHTPELDVEWDSGNIGFVAAANPQAWGAVPEGVTPLTMYFSVYLGDDVDSELYYSAVVDQGELMDVVMSQSGEIIGNIYLQKMDAGAVEGADDNDQHYSLSIITDEGMIGRAYFGYGADSPVSHKILSFYTKTLEVMVRAIGASQEFYAAVSDFEAGQSIRKSLEIILVNSKEDNAAADWFHPVDGLARWKLFLPYTEDGFTNSIYQHVTEHPIEEIEEMLYRANRNALPWLGKATQFLVRPSLKDIRLSSYSPILVTIEPNAAKTSGLLIVEPTDYTRTIDIDGIKATIYSGNQREPARHREREIEISTFRSIAVINDIDLMVSFDYISHNEHDAYEQDVNHMTINLVKQLQGMSI